MSLTYGYDLKEYRDDDMVAAPVQITETLGRLVLPGAMLVNHFPFCTVASYYYFWHESHNCL
jgi:hypothetical protein